MQCVKCECVSLYHIYADGTLSDSRYHGNWTVSDVLLEQDVWLLINYSHFVTVYI